MIEDVRQRIVRVAVAAVVIALLLFAVPLAVVIRTALFDDERRELEGTALQAAVRIDPDFAHDDPIELPPNEQQVGVYDVALRLRFGHGPQTGDAVVQRAATGSVADGQSAGELIVAVPVTSEEKVVGVVRAAQPVQVIWNRVLLAWLALAALAAAAFGVAVVVARRQARHLSAPLEALAETSERIAAGDLTVRAELSTIPEIGRVAETHNAMVDKLGDMLQRERHFTANASHQLRTPLTGLQLGLEAAQEQAAQNPEFDLRPALQEANDRAEELHRTIDDLLQVARLPSDQWAAAEPVPLDDVLTEAERRWHGPLAKQGRRLTLRRRPGMAAAEVPGRVVDQILDILIDNASRHGAGAVTLTARDIGDAAAIDVADEGSLSAPTAELFTRGASSNSGHGIGLGLAQSLAEACGGRLNLTSPAPTTFSLVLPNNAADETREL
ncbi:MAG TPA: HAMP domain-containing sensor histidine kinase [Propionibacteriaceae bacterium]|nr:HAMP domain-containing sensor histidine kinase [Propionibacteriaceae bacterium]